MTEKEFLDAVSNGGDDIIEQFLGHLKKARARYCVIGGLAVNAYAEPVVSLDLDVVVVADALDRFLSLAGRRLKIRRFAPSINLTAARSDLRIQIQTNPRYLDFIPRSSRRRVLGYSMRVASLDDVFQGKLWAYADTRRRRSKRQKDLADMYRLAEAYPRLRRLLPKV